MALTKFWNIPGFATEGLKFVKVTTEITGSKANLLQILKCIFSKVFNFEELVPSGQLFSIYRIASCKILTLI